MRLVMLATCLVALACSSRAPAPTRPATSPPGGAGGAPRAEPGDGDHDDDDPGMYFSGGDEYAHDVDAGSPADCVDNRLVGCREDDCVAEAQDQGATQREAESECELYCFCGL